MVRKICYLTGTRADFGLMRRTLTLLHSARDVELGLIVTGSHLSARHGLTVREVEHSLLPVWAKVPMLPEEDSGAAMARGVGRAIQGVSRALESLRPDLLLVLGDRGEMLAGALAAIHMNIPVAHAHGGEVSGTIDESVRHAITKLSHLHLTATEESARRVRRLGEDAWRVFHVGAPGLDDILRERRPPRAEVCRRYRLDARKPYLLVLQHPVTQEVRQSGGQMRATLEAVLRYSSQALVVEPNSDAGHSAMRGVLAGLNGRGGALRVHAHVPRPDYAGLLAGAAALVGNSSSGIIEAASLGVPVVNVGSRQNLRERNPNVLDVGHERAQIERALRKSISDKAFLRKVARRENRYGDGRASERISKILREVELSPLLLYKALAY